MVSWILFSMIINNLKQGEKAARIKSRGIGVIMGSLLLSLQLRIKRIPQPISDQVKPQDSYHDKET